MKILHVITGLGNGGAENVLFQVCKEELACRHAVICLGEAGVYARRLKQVGVPIHCLRLQRIWQIIPGVLRLSRWIRKTKPDVVQTWMYHADLIGGFAAKLASRVPVIWGVRASDAFRMPGYLRLRLLVPLCALFSRILPSRIVFNSHEGARVHISMGYLPDRCKVISNGVDSRKYSPDAGAARRARRSWRVPAGKAILGTVARWDPIKNHALLAEALHQLNASTTLWHAVWIGPGISQENKDLVELLESFSLRPQITLGGASTDLQMAFNGMDLHVLPSRSEAFPNVLAEAMACGTPCVATRVGDAGRILGKTGWLVNTGDPGTLAKILCQALRAMKNRRTWAVRGIRCRRRMIQHFGVGRMTGAYRRTWQGVAARSSQGTRSECEFPRHKHPAGFQSHGKRRPS